MYFQEVMEIINEASNPRRDDIFKENPTQAALRILKAFLTHINNVWDNDDIQLSHFRDYVETKHPDMGVNDLLASLKNDARMVSVISQWEQEFSDLPMCVQQAKCPGLRNHIEPYPL